MPEVITEYNEEGVDESVLGGTGSGGLLSAGYLREEPLGSYVGDDESVIFVRSNAKHGLTRSSPDGEERERHVPGDGYRAFAVATDTHVHCIIGDNETGTGPNRKISVHLADIEIVDGSDRLLVNEFVVLTRADVRWRFPSAEPVGELVAYLTEATDAWKQFVTRLESARRHLVEAEQRREAHEYDRALETVETASDETEAARDHERAFVSAGVPAMGERIERTEVRVTETRVRTLEGRATHALNRAEQLWREDDFAGAYEQFRSAHEDYVTAIAVQDTDFEDSLGLRKKLARVERNLASLERAPIERGEQARERAYEAEDLTERADALERALGRFRQALELDWGSDHKRFAIDRAVARERIDAVASELVETRRRLAATRVRDGDAHREAGRDVRARERYREARTHLESTLETARELVPEETEPLESHLEAVEAKVQEATAGDVYGPVSGD